MIAMRRCYAISIIGMEGKNMNHNKKKILKVTALFVFMFFLGWGAGSLQKQQMKKQWRQCLSRIRQITGDWALERREPSRPAM